MYMRPFPFWVHKTLPLVYDDSLSYYELLCKVVKYLNDTTNETNRLSAELERFEKMVQEEFDSLDIDQVVADRLDQMVEDGELAEIVEQITRGSANVLNSDLTVTMPDLDEELDQFTSLANWRAADIIELFDAIPELEKHTYGLDDAGNPLIYYDYTAPIQRNITSLDSYIEANNGLPFLLFVSGVHGIEKGAVAATYLTVKTWFDNPDKFASIVNNVSMRIIPVAAPSAFNANATRNSNGVNINRNFPNNFEAGPSYGAVALDQPEAAFLAAMVDELSAKWQSGLFVVDAHQFTTSAGQHSVFWYNCSSDIANYQEVRNGLYKTVGYLRDKVLERIPALTPTEGETGFCKFLGISYEPTFESYFAFSGASGFLCEAPSEIMAGVRYSKDSIWLNYTILSNSVWCTMANFFPGGRNKVVSLAQIGCTTANTLLEVCANMPYRSTLDYEVADGTTLDSSFPALLGAVSVHIESLSKAIKQVTIRSSSATGLVTLEFTNTVNGTYSDLTEEWSYAITHRWIATTPFGMYQMFPKEADFARIKDLLNHTNMLATYTVKTWTDDQDVSHTIDYDPPEDGLLLAFAPIVTAGTYAHGWLVNIPQDCSQIAIAHFTPSTAANALVWKKVDLSAIE